jgi:hypothetical protein
MLHAVYVPSGKGGPANPVSIYSIDMLQADLDCGGKLHSPIHFQEKSGVVYWTIDLDQ